MTVPTPDASESWIDPIINAMQSDAAASGHFERVHKHEPKKSPGNGLTASIWAQSIGPVRSSGLSVTSALVVFNLRIFCNMLREPQDDIDLVIMQAMANLIRRYHDNFDFGLTDLVRNVDVFGANGVELSAQMGYIPQDGKLYRAATLTIPVIVNDVWPQNVS